jgi:asparaginyl-tRNA synthetase
LAKKLHFKGWLFNKRSSGKVKFLILRDGTGYLQCIVFKGNVSEDVFEVASGLTQESSFEVTGTVKAEERAMGGVELDATDVKLVTLAEEYPITKKEHGIEFLIDHRHLWLRSKKQVAIMKIRHQCNKSNS